METLEAIAAYTGIKFNQASAEVEFPAYTHVSEYVPRGWTPDGKPFGRAMSGIHFQGDGRKKWLESNNRLQRHLETKGTSLDYQEKPEKCSTRSQLYAFEDGSLAVFENYEVGSGETTEEYRRPEVSLKKGFWANLVGATRTEEDQGLVLEKTPAKMKINIRAYGKTQQMADQRLEELTKVAQNE